VPASIWDGFKDKKQPTCKNIRPVKLRAAYFQSLNFGLKIGRHQAASSNGGQREAWGRFPLPQNALLGRRGYLGSGFPYKPARQGKKAKPAPWRRRPAEICRAKSSASLRKAEKVFHIFGRNLGP
jgi:hypothetical protein